jgi:hypothetical protein
VAISACNYRFRNNRSISRAKGEQTDEQGDKQMLEP